MKLKEIYIRWIGIPMVAYIAEATNSDHLSEQPYWYQYLIAFAFTAVYWNGASFIIGYFRKKFEGISMVRTRLLVTSLGIIIWMTIGGIPIQLLFGLSEPSHLLEMKTHTEFLPFNFIAALVISLLYEAFYFFEKWKEAFRLNEELKNRQIRTQYEVLQNQMSPHFLFNSLNTLATIIQEDQAAAIKFTENLSEVYRYILHNKDKELVPLSEELDFVKSYLFLLSIRYPDNLTADFRIDKKYLKRSIPPLTLQMLVENAIKHNVISKSKPLHVDIYIENGKSIIVKNNLQLKGSIEKSTKTGLENIRKRYSILGGKQIDIITSAANFMVAVPLIDLVNEKDIQMA